VRTRDGRILALTLVVALTGCTSTPDGTEPAVSVEPSVPPDASASSSERAAPFPIAVFADISEEPVSEEVAAELQAILNDMAGGGGMAATVMSPDGTWSGAVGKADGVRALQVDDQFHIASITKSVIAAQVMQMVEAGELALDDPAADHLPPDLDFDTNGATIVDLLGQRSGIPGSRLDELAFWESLSTDHPKRRWTTAEALELVTADRAPAGEAFVYTDANYLLLGLVIEQVRGRPVAEVLREGVLDIDGVERLIYQPDEAPTDPMAMPGGESTAVLEKGGGYLPSLAAATAYGAAAAMASDSPSLARWWRAFCAGEIVSQDSLTEMATFHDGYGLGLFSLYGGAVGHGGADVGYAAWAGCLPEDGAVVVVLANQAVDDIGAMAGPLVIAARPD
jgi:D-alanyl-D-alanine carboxypeptidase